MGSVVALESFKAALGKKESKSPARKAPKIVGIDIWGRDYTQVEAIVFALLKVRDIVFYHAGEQDMEFDHFCINALDAGYHIDDKGPAKLKASIKPIKEWILDSMTEDNKRDMSWALVLLDLVEKSPTK